MAIGQGGIAWILYMHVYCLVHMLLYHAGCLKADIKPENVKSAHRKDKRPKTLTGFFIVYKKILFSQEIFSPTSSTVLKSHQHHIQCF
jgi:hypothetical protein